MVSKDESVVSKRPDYPRFTVGSPLEPKQTAALSKTSQ